MLGRASVLTPELKIDQHSPPMPASPVSAAAARIETETAGGHHAPRSGADFRR